MGRMAVLALVTSGSACQGHGMGIEPRYEGCATDESWVVLDDYVGTGRVRTDAARAAVFTAPKSGDAPSAQRSLVVRFQPAQNMPGTEGGDATCAQANLASVGRALRPSHLPPVSGTLFDLKMLVGGDVIERVLTTRQTVTFAAETMQKGAGQRVTWVLTSAKLLQNEVAEGPFAGEQLTLSVTP